jgi:hypothetical protein
VGCVRRPEGTCQFFLPVVVDTDFEVVERMRDGKSLQNTAAFVDGLWNVNTERSEDLRI